MNRLVSFVIVLILLFSLFPVGVSANEVVENGITTVYFDDGSYMVIELFYVDARAASSRTGYKRCTRFANNGDLEWEAVLTATFTYDGTTSSCTSATCYVEITDTSWYVVSKSAVKSGNTAIADFTIGRKFLGITIDKESVSLVLTCDEHGKLN